MVRDISLRRLKKSQHSNNGKKEQPNPLSIGIGLRTPEEGDKFINQDGRGSYGQREMQSLNLRVQQSIRIRLKRQLVLFPNSDLAEPHNT